MIFLQFNKFVVQRMISNTYYKYLHHQGFVLYMRLIHFLSHLISQIDSSFKFDFGNRKYKINGLSITSTVRIHVVPSKKVPFYFLLIQLIIQTFSKLNIMAFGNIIAIALLVDHDLKFSKNKIHGIQRFLIVLKNVGVHVLISSSPLLFQLVLCCFFLIISANVARKLVRHSLLKLEQIVMQLPGTTSSNCLIHCQLGNKDYFLQSIDLTIVMDSQQRKPNQQQQYEQKIKRLIKRWTNTKHEVVRSKKQRLEEQNIKTQQLQDLQEGFVIETKKTPVYGKFQVVVVGGGPAGLSAAIASSRAGAQTLIIQKFGCFGGVITTVGMETLGWYRYQGTSDAQGIGRQLERVAKTMGASSKWAFNDSQCLDAQQFKIIADKLIEDNGIKPLLHTYVVDSIVKNGKIVGLIVESKSGRQAIYADRVIDCSGDADVAYFSGCRYSTLPLEKSLGVTTVFNVAGVNKEKFLQYINKNPQTYKDWNTGTWQQDTTGKQDDLKSPYFGRQFQEAQAKGLIQTQDKKNLDITGSWSALSQAGEATNLNLVHMTGYNVLNNQDLTKAEIQGRKGSIKALNALKQLVPGFEKAKLRNLAMTLGVRDSRKIIGQYNLTAEDVCMQGRFEDSVGVFPEFVDGYSILILPSTGRYFQIPFRCLVPDIDNLLVAGRCVSGDMVSHAATRNMMCCTVTGQAAGVAAAISLKLGVSTHKINLRRQGARIQ